MEQYSVTCVIHAGLVAGRLRSESIFISLLSDGSLEAFTAPPELSSLITSEALVALALKGGHKPGAKEGQGASAAGAAAAAGELKGASQAGVSLPQPSSQAASAQLQQQQNPASAQPAGMAAGGMRLSVTDEVRLQQGGQSLCSASHTLLICSCTTP
jgi:hypothetical protein